MNEFNDRYMNNFQELSDLLEEKNKSLARLQLTHDQKIKGLQEELDKERGKLASLHFRFQGILVSNAGTEF